MSEEFENALEEMELLMGSVKTAILGSVSPKGIPLSSYAPFYVDAEPISPIPVESNALHRVFGR